MGQSACNKCNDVSINKNAPRALDDEDTEEEEEHSEGGSEEDEDKAEAEAKDAKEEAKQGAELALQDGLKRGKTSTFAEAIEHSRAVGLDEDKIQLAEKKLEDHKQSRRKEAFEAELYDFLQSEEANDAQNCQDKLDQGQEYGISDKTLKPVQERMLELELMKELNKEEIEQAKQFLELCTRRFVASCIAKGRDIHWIDLESGSKHKAVLKMDVVLKNFTVTGPPDGDLTCKVADITTKRAADAEEIAKKKGFEKLGESDRVNTVAVLLPSGKGPWCFLESSSTSTDEFIVAFQVFNGLAAFSKSGAATTKPAGKKKKPDLTVNIKKASEEEAAEDNLRSAAEGGEEEPLSPISPRGKEARKGGKKGASERKGKTEPPPEEEKKEAPPLPPPPDNKEEEEAEAEEEALSEEAEE